MAQQAIEATHRGGWPRMHPYGSFTRRAREAWWVLTGRYSLHLAWQRGYDCHIQDDSKRRANLVGHRCGECDQKIPPLNERAQINAALDAAGHFLQSHVDGSFTLQRK